MFTVHATERIIDGKGNKRRTWYQMLDIIKVKGSNVLMKVIAEDMGDDAMWRPALVIERREVLVFQCVALFVVSHGIGFIM